MNTLIEDSEKYLQSAEKIIIDFYNNNIVQSMLTLFLVLYGGKAVKSLPDNVVQMFQLPIFRIISIGLTAVVIGAASPSTGVMAAVGFILTLTLLKKIPFFGNSNFPMNTNNTPANNNPANNNPANNTPANNTPANNTNGKCIINNSSNNHNKQPEGLVDAMAANAAPVLSNNCSM